MAENIYSRGTRVWFEDKDHAWISAEVTSVTKSPDGAIKLVFIDDRGKVDIVFILFLLSLRLSRYRKSLYTRPGKTSGTEGRVYRR